MFFLKFHAALDVFLCTSSILNLCLISLDRYWWVRGLVTSRLVYNLFSWVKLNIKFLLPSDSLYQKQFSWFKIERNSFWPSLWRFIWQFSSIILFIFKFKCSGLWLGLQLTSGSGNPPLSISQDQLCRPQDRGEGLDDDTLGMGLQPHRLYPSPSLSSLEHSLQEPRGQN